MPNPNGLMKFKMTINVISLDRDVLEEIRQEFNTLLEKFRNLRENNIKVTKASIYST